MKWFPFRTIMLHTENYINSPEEHFQSLFKLFSMFKLMIWYYETISTKLFPDHVGIMCINCGKTIGCLLYNQTI